jgi:hypothetical protein
MKKTAIISLLGLFILFSCRDEEDYVVSVGETFLSSQTSIALIDTLSVEMSSLKFDSTVTSNSGSLLVGKYSDTYLGEISSTSYLQFELPESYTVDDDEIFDSILVVFPYDGSWYGDTIPLQTFSIHEVLVDIEPVDDDNDPYIYNSASFSYDPDPLGSLTFTTKPNFYDTLAIRLSDTWGESFLSLMNDDDDGDFTDDFVDYFKGIAVVPGDDNTTILSFPADETVYLRLYSHLVAEEKTELSYKFPLYTSGYSSNNITSETSGKYVDMLTPDEEEYSSSIMGDMAFVEAGIGIATRLDFPSLSKILELETTNVLYKAELILRPVPGSDDNVDLPSTMVLYSSDKYNNLNSLLYDDDDNAVTPDFYEDEFYGEDTYYLFDVTNYIYDELSDGFADPEAGLIVKFYDSQFTGTLDRVVFDARSATKYKPMLNLYYILYE